MPSNQSLLQKADIAIADLSANGGTLLPEQGAYFIRKLIKSPTLIRVCRTVEMLASQRKINKIGFATRILRKATSGVALTAAQRSKPTTSQIQLNTSENIAEVRLPYDVLEDNIERATTATNEVPNTGPDGLRQTLLDLIAERAALDIEELALLGDTAYVNAGDPDDQAYLSQFDGWLKVAATGGHVVDAGNTTISRATFKSGVKALPSQYKRNVAALQQYVSVNNETEYRDTLATRIGQLGDGTEGIRLRLLGGEGGDDAGGQGSVHGPAEPHPRHSASGLDGVRQGHHRPRLHHRSDHAPGGTDRRARCNGRVFEHRHLVIAVLA